MPIDPRIALGVQPIQINDPMQTLAQISQIKNQQLIRQQAQQKFEQDQFEFQEKQQDVQYKRAARDTLNRVMQTSFNEDGTFNRNALRQGVVNAGYGSLWPDLEKELADIDQKVATTAKSKQDLQVGYLDLIGTAAAKVKALPEPLQMSALQTLTARYVKDGIVPEAIAYEMLEQVMVDPSRLPQVLDNAIAVSPAQQKMIAERPRPIGVSEGERLYDPVTRKEIFKNEKTEKEWTEYTGFDAYVRGPFAMEKGKDYKNLTDADWQEAREKYRLDERISVHVQNQQAELETLSGAPLDWQLAFSRATDDLTPAKKNNRMRTFNLAMQNGRLEEAGEIVMQAAIESENVDDQRRIMGRREMAAALGEVREVLKQVPTNYLKATAEDTAAALGLSTDPKLRALKTRLESIRIDYRRATTGVQFSQPEDKQYADLLPDYHNTMPVNLAVIDGLISQMNTNDKVYWKNKVGLKGAELVGALPKATEQPATTTQPFKVGNFEVTVKP